MPSAKPSDASPGSWYGTVIEVTGTEATVDLRRDGSADMIAEVDLSKWNLTGIVPGDVLILDPVAATVTQLDLGTWTQEELDAAQRYAVELHAQLMENCE